MVQIIYIIYSICHHRQIINSELICLPCEQLVAGYFAFQGQPIGFPTGYPLVVHWLAVGDPWEIHEEPMGTRGKPMSDTWAPMGYRRQLIGYLLLRTHGHPSAGDDTTSKN